MPDRVIPRPVARVALVLFGCLSLGACALLGNLFSPYSQQLQASRVALQQGDPERAWQRLPVGGGERLLRALEQGRVAFLRGHWEESRQRFAAAIRLLEAEREQASYRLSHGVQQAVALVSNDSVTDYWPPVFEQVMVHHYQALNYLFLGDREGSLVEVRRANQLQEAYRRELAVEARPPAPWLRRSLAAAQPELPSMDTLIGNPHDSFQNAYSLYVSALLYEISGLLDDAYIDYKRAYEIYPDNPYVQDALLRLAGQLGREQELRQFERVLGRPAPVVALPQGQLVVLHESGLVPVKHSASLTLPVQHRDGSWSWYRMAVPVYHNDGPSAQPLSLWLDTRPVGGKTRPIADLSRMSAKSLAEQYPAILTRQLLRVVSKEQIRQVAQEKAGDWGGLLSNLYNVLSERADTRSWLTLPRQARIWHAPIDAGRIRLHLQGALEQRVVPVDIRAGQVSLVLVSEINGHLFPTVMDGSR